MSRRFPAWVLTQRPDTRITIASYETGVARRWGRAIRDDITQNQDQLGISVRPDVSAQGEWLLDGHDGGVFTAGIGSALTGRPSDLMIVDDPTKGRQDADSKTYQERNWDWWREVAMTRLAPGAPAIIVMTRWSENDLGGMVLRPENGGEDWRVLNVPAQADHNPEAGETDPLGREPGEWLQTTRGMTPAQWERRKRDTGPWSWAAVYQGRPAPAEGGIFPRDWPTYDQKFWTQNVNGVCHVPGVGERPDHELIMSWDLSFKGTATSDFTVGQVWLRIGSNVYLLDMVRGRMDFTQQVQAVQALAAKWPQAGAKLIEEAANGAAVINMLKGTIPGIIPVRPDGGKVTRAHAVSPFIHARNVHLPDAALVPNVVDLRAEAIDFPNSAHDDTIDALTQALNQLLLNPITGHRNPLDEVDPGDWRDDY